MQQKIRNRLPIFERMFFSHFCRIISDILHIWNGWKTNVNANVVLSSLNKLPYIKFRSPSSLFLLCLLILPSLLFCLCTLWVCFTYSMERVVSPFRDVFFIEIIAICSRCLCSVACFGDGMLLCSVTELQFYEKSHQINTMKRNTDVWIVLLQPLVWNVLWELRSVFGFCSGECALFSYCFESFSSSFFSILTFNKEFAQSRRLFNFLYA